MIRIVRNVTASKENKTSQRNTCTKIRKFCYNPKEKPRIINLYFLFICEKFVTNEPNWLNWTSTHKKKYINKLNSFHPLQKEMKRATTTNISADANTVMCRYSKRRKHSPFFYSPHAFDPIYFMWFMAKFEVTPENIHTKFIMLISVCINVWMEFNWFYIDKFLFNTHTQLNVVACIMFVCACACVSVRVSKCIEK